MQDKYSIIREALERKASISETDRAVNRDIERPHGYELVDGIRSWDRVVDLAEVFTPGWLVEDMMECIPSNSLLVDTRYLEPSCGNGNFLVEIVAKKLQTIETPEPEDSLMYLTLRCLMSTYGVDISESNIQEARQRISKLVETFLGIVGQAQVTSEFRRSMNYILEKNVLCSDFLKDLDNIEIVEFTFPKKFFVSQRIFTMLELVEMNSDLLVFPRPSRVLPTTHFLELR